MFCYRSIRRQRWCSGTRLSREELQASNEELQTKLDDLALAQSDMQNVLNSIEIAVLFLFLFLDQDLNVRRYTERAAAIINLRENDIGRQRKAD